MKFIVSVFIIALSAGFSLGVSAERVEGLYQYSTLVSGQGQREYQQALNDGLAEVIVRVSGSVQVLRNSGIQNALSKASRFLLEQAYQVSDQTLKIDGRDLPASKLVLEYSGEAIENLLRELELPLWPNNRRNVLVWMVVDDSNGRRVVSDLNFLPAQQALTANAQRRGLPLVKPLMDLEDQIALSANQLWSMSISDIRHASERYNPDTILAGRLSQTSRGDWRSDWQLISGSDIELFDAQERTIDDAIAGGMDQVADHFFRRYAINPQQSSAQDVLLLQVADIDSFADYTKMLNYIEQLTLVRRVDLVAARDDNLLLYLYADGSVNLLQDTLELDAKMLPLNNNVNSGTANLSPLGSVDNPLLYAWRP